MQDQFRLLLSIPNVVASQIYEGEQSVLAQGTLNVSLLSQRYDLTPPADVDGGSSSSSQQLSHGPVPSDSQTYQATSYPSEKKRLEVDDDLFLYVSIGQDEFDLPLPANTKIIPQRKSAYLIPSRDIPNALIQLNLGSSSPDDLET